MLRRVSVPDHVAQATFSPDGQRLGLALGRGGLWMLAVPGGAVQRVDAPPVAASSVDFDARGRLATADLSGQLRLDEAALRRTSGNRRQAAEQRGIGLRTFYEKLKRYPIG